MNTTSNVEASANQSVGRAENPILGRLAAQRVERVSHLFQSLRRGVAFGPAVPHGQSGSLARVVREELSRRELRKRLCMLGLPSGWCQGELVRLNLVAGVTLRRGTTFRLATGPGFSMRLYEVFPELL